MAKHLPCSPAEAPGRPKPYWALASGAEKGQQEDATGPSGAAAMKQIQLNEEQREQFGNLQLQYQELRKKNTSVTAQVRAFCALAGGGRLAWTHAGGGDVCVCCTSLGVQPDFPLTTAHAPLQLSLADRDKKKHNLTLRELESLPEGTNTYQGVGKMFLLVRMCSDELGAGTGRRPVQRAAARARVRPLTRVPCHVCVVHLQTPCPEIISALTTANEKCDTAVASLGGNPFPACLCVPCLLRLQPLLLHAEEAPRRRREASTALAG